MREQQQQRWSSALGLMFGWATLHPLKPGSWTVTLLPVDFFHCSCYIHYAELRTVYLCNPLSHTERLIKTERDKIQPYSRCWNYPIQSMWIMKHTILKRNFSVLTSRSLLGNDKSLFFLWYLSQISYIRYFLKYLLPIKLGFSPDCFPLQSLP